MASSTAQISSYRDGGSDAAKKKTYYIDATGLIAGRICSNVAKLLLEGNRVIIVHAENALLSGSRKMVVDEWLARLKIASVVHPKHGPFHPRTPSGIVTRMVRGMIPRRKPRGRFALKRLRVYSGIPEELVKLTFESFEDSKATKPAAFYVRLSEVSSRIGWKGPVER